MIYSIKKSFIFFSLLTLILLPFSNVFAQIPSDLSQVKASQITDAQLLQFIKKAQSSGMTENDLMQQLQQKGLPDTELQLLSTRIKNLMAEDNTTVLTPDRMEINAGNKRVYNGEITEFKMPLQPSRVFGSELFSGVDPVFVPNLKIATPKGYIIGPEDELQLEVYGNNISSQKLMVSPDGLINVKYTGPVNVSGMTIEQATGVLKARLTKYYPELASGATKLQLTLGSVRSIQVTVVGAVKKPGTVTLPSIATLFNALYSSGGPLDNGSFRNIELIRNNKTIALADLYEFILKGDQSANVSLHDNDVIRVPFAKTQIVLDGELNRKGIFEVKEGESLQQALDFAGGFKSNAFKGRITGTGFTDVERKVIDVAKESFASFNLNNGDSLYIDSVVNRFDNRVIISGAVFKPGAYSIEKGLDLKELILKAQGLKEDAFLGRANLVRVREDKTKEYKSLNLKSIIKNNQAFALVKEDSIHIVSILELRDSSTVSLIGPVKKPGDFRYEDSLTLQGLLLQSGGFLENATPIKIEIGRRNTALNVGEKGALTSQIISIDLKKDLSDFGADIILKPFDIISVKVDPNKVKQISVKVTGEVFYTGSYTLISPEERLSSVLKRAGGILSYADIDGAKLIRKKEMRDTAQIKRLALSTFKISNLKDNLKEDTSNIISNDELKSNTTEVALNLRAILEKTETADDPTLIDGDELIVPRFNNTVNVGGEVLKPVSVQYESGKGFSSYLSAAGGYTRNAFRNRAFVVYPNGRAAKTHQFLGIRVYPKITPGSSVFIPLKPDTKGFDPAKAGILVSAFSAVMTGLVLLFR